MEPIKHSLPVIAVIFLVLTGCSKVDTSISTSLNIRVIDKLGNSISGVAVKLYSALEDLEHQEKQTGLTQTSDRRSEV